jgi:DnaJ-class molecular chaperone
MKEKRKYYELLGILHHASHKKIQIVYKKYSLQYHPDKKSICPYSQ